MPPPVEAIPLPKTRGNDAMRYLESIGLPAIEPTIRSSDYESVLSCPYGYYLRRRLGLNQKLSWSEALSRGSWFHKCFELDKLDDIGTPNIDKVLSDRLRELREVCKSIGIIGDAQDKILDRERKDAMCARGWYEPSLTKVHTGRGPVSRFLAMPYWQDLGAEVYVRVEHPRDGPDLVAQYDRLLYHQDHNSLFVVDLKTCGGSALNRLMSCPIEFQSQHYIAILEMAVKSGLFHQHYPDIPKDVKVAGMMHVAVCKPPISLAASDRNFTQTTREITRGPNKGEMRAEKKYYGEPLLENYLKRCESWYTATGEYEHLEGNHAQDPPVNISISFRDIIEGEALEEYHARLNLITQYATCTPLPKNFPRSANSMRGFGRQLAPLAPFYLAPIHNWSQVMADGDWMRTLRDEVLVSTPHIKELA